MPRKATGEVKFKAGFWVARVTLIGRNRPEIRLTNCHCQEDAQTRADLLCEQIKRLRAAGVVETEAALVLLREVGAASKEQLSVALTVLGELCSGESGEAPEPVEVMTFRKVGEMWTNGEMSALFDTVEVIDHEINVQRLERGIYPRIGDRPIVSVGLDDFDLVMRNLRGRKSTKKGGTGENGKLSKSSRRHYAQLVNRVLNLAVLAGFIKFNPIPKGRIPKPGPRVLFPILYPREDDQLMAAVVLPFQYRLLWGVLHREGMRREEIVLLDWEDFDLENGTITLPKNKSKKPRWWKLDPGSLVALRVLHYQRKHSTDGPGVGLNERVFLDPHGRPHRLNHLTKIARSHLTKATILRADLHSKGEQKGHFGMHCYRRSFVTLNLANGFTADYVSQRSGHSLSQLEKYRQPAKGLEELKLGGLTNLAASLPEVRDFLADCPRDFPWAPPGGGKVARKSWIVAPVVAGSIPVIHPRNSEETADQVVATYGQSQPDATPVGNQMGNPLAIALRVAMASAVNAGQWATAETLAAELKKIEGK